MKTLLIKLLVVLVLVFPPMAAGISAVTTTSGVHTVQHTHQMASRRPPCYHGVPEPWCPPGY